MHYYHTPPMIHTSLAFLFLGQISENSWITICASAVTLGTLIISMIRDNLNRKEDRKDRMALAALTEKKAEEVKAAGAKREAAIVEVVNEVGKKADAAYEAGNGNQEKFAAVNAILTTHSEALAKPTEVVVTNDENHRIPTTIK